MRQGTIKIVVDPQNDTYTISDDYEFTGDDNFIDSIEFDAQNYNLGGSGIDTVALMMLNSNDNGVMHFKVKTKA